MNHDWNHIWLMLRTFSGGRSFETDYAWLKSQMKNTPLEAA